MVFNRIALFATLFVTSTAFSAPDFIKVDKVYHFLYQDDRQAMVVVQKDNGSDWVRVKPVDENDATPIWLNLNNIDAIKPL